MNIHWFPGHMNKARRELAERVKKSDLVIELLDARLPKASANPMLEGIRGSLPCLKLLTKADLADDRVTALWMRRLERDGVVVQDVVSTDAKLASKLAKASQLAAPGRGRPGFPVRAMIVGIPNVGKSTLFNTLLGSAKAEVRNKPAVTRREQQAQVSNDFLIVDTPGVLWPKLENQRAAQCLALAGSVGDAAFDPVRVAGFALELFWERYPNALTSRYGIDAASAEGSRPDGLELLDAVGRRRGCLIRGGQVDLTKAASIVLTDVRAAKMGRISFETPDDYDTAENGSNGTA